MLTHKTHRSAIAVVAYFRDHLRADASSTGEYLDKSAAEPAVWQGDVARYLGIEGQVVTEDTFLAAALGRKPVDVPEAFAQSPRVRAYLEARPLAPSAVRKHLSVVLPDGTQGTIDAIAADGQSVQVRRQGRRKTEVVAVDALHVRGAQPHWSAAQRLTQRQTKRVGFDMTLSAPKGFSLLLNAGDTRLDGAFDRALTRLMARVEDEAFVRARGQGRSDDERVRSSSLLWTRFKHETSRPVRQEDGSWSTDPHRHAHVFVFNTTRSNHAGPGKGPLYALEPGPINERFPYFEAVFDNLLAEEVQGLGYGVHRRGQSFEIDGVTPEMVRAFSERTAEIDQLAAALGLSDVQKANAGVFLRARKGEVSVEDMRAHMTQRRPRIVERLDQIHAEAQGAVSRSKLSVEGQQKRAHDAVDAAAHAAVARSLERGLERKSTTPLDRLLRDALIHAAGGASEPQILSALREHKGLFVEPNERGDRYNVTTREVLEDERGLIAAMRRAQGSQRPLAPDVEPSTRLNERQQQALEHVLLSKDRLTAIRGRPGVGKSWVIEDLYRALDDRGISVVPLAPTVAASRGALREAGLAHANTLAAFLDGQNKEARVLRKMARTGVIVLDEAGMVGTADFRRLLERAEQIDARVVAIGDTGQLGTMARGDGLRLLEKHGLPAADIDEILRQKNAAYLAVVEAFSDGDAALGMARAVEAGYVVDLEGAVEGVQVEGHPEVAAAAVRQLAADRTADEASEAAARGKSFMAVVPTHALGDDVSQAIRARHQASGTIKEDAVTLTLYWPTAKLQADNAEYRFTLEADEFAVVHRDVPELGLRAGDRLETFEDAKGRRGFKHGARVLDGPVPSMAFEVYREKLLPVAIGDRLRAVERIKLQGQGHAEIPRGTLLEVEKITRHGTRVEFTNGQFVSAQDVRSLTYGYAVTQPASQGLSADEVVFVATTDTFGAITKESANVAVSRGKEKLTIITDDLEGLQEQLKRSRKAPFAGEIVGDVDEHSPVGDEGRAHRHESVDELLTRLERLEGSQTGDQSGQRRDEGRARRGDAPMGVDEGVREGVGAARPSEPRAAVVVDGPVYGAVMATSSPKEPTTKKQLVVPKAERRPTGGGAERVFDGLWGPAVRRATPSPFRPHRPARSVREDHGAGILTPRLGPAGGHDSLDGRGTGSASAPALQSAEAGGFEGRPAWSAGPVEEEGGRSSEKGPGLASSARVSRREDVGVGDAEDAGRPVVDGMARRSVQSARAEGVDRRGIQALDPLALDFDNDAPRVRRSAARSKLGHADEAGQGDGAQDDARSVGAVRDLRSSSLPSLPRDLAGRRSARGQDDAQDDDTPNLAKTSESAASDARRAVNRREIAGPAGTLGLGGVAGIVEDEGMAMYASAPVEISSSRPPVGADRASGAAGSVGAKTGGAGSVDVGSGASSAPNDRGDKASSSPDDQRGRSDQTPAMPRGGRPHIGLRTDEPKKRRVRPSSTEAEEAQRARRAEEQDARAQAAEEDRQASLQVNRVQNASAEVERLKAAADHYPDDSGVQQAIEEAEVAEADAHRANERADAWAQSYVGRFYRWLTQPAALETETVIEAPFVFKDPEADDAVIDDRAESEAAPIEGETSSQAVEMITGEEGDREASSEAVHLVDDTWVVDASDVVRAVDVPSGDEGFASAEQASDDEPVPAAMLGARPENLDLAEDSAVSLAGASEEPSSGRESLPDISSEPSVNASEAVPAPEASPAPESEQLRAADENNWIEAPVFIELDAQVKDVHFVRQEQPDGTDDGPTVLAATCFFSRDEVADVQRDFTLQTGHAPMQQTTDAHAGDDQVVDHSEPHHPAAIDDRAESTDSAVNTASALDTDAPAEDRAHEAPPWATVPLEAYENDGRSYTVADAERDIDALNAQLAAQAEADDDAAGY